MTSTLEPGASVQHYGWGHGLHFERPAELVEVSELMLHRIFAVGLWVAVACAAFSLCTSFLQPAEAVIRGVVVSSTYLALAIVAARHPAELYSRLRRRPRLLLAAGTFLGLSATLVGKDNFQLFVAIVAIIGVPGIATPPMTVTGACVLAAAGLGAPQFVHGHPDLGPVITVLVPPLMFWLIADRIARFALRLHQSLEHPAQRRVRRTLRGFARQRERSEERTDSFGKRSLGLPMPGSSEIAGVTLTARQLQVVLLSCEGLNHREIGECLGGITAGTVARHIGKACSRTGTRNEEQLAAWARRSALIPPTSNTRARV